MDTKKVVKFTDCCGEGNMNVAAAKKLQRKKGGKDREKDDNADGGRGPQEGAPAFKGIATRIKMGKKIEKSLTKDKNQSSASQETQDDDPNKTPEPYSCTGSFQNDFMELCRRNNMTIMPQIVLRPKPPPSPSQVPEGKPEKGKDKNKLQVPPEPEPEPELTEDGEPVELPPKTYTTKDKFEYFKPSIQVEMDNPDKLDTVTEIYIRGWKIDDTMMDIFRQCWPAMEKLHTINLWQVGLTGETVSVLGAFLPHCLSVKNLILDGNWMKDENWHELIGDDSIVQNLSLQHCLITDKGAEGIGKALGTSKKSNTKLLSLCLSGNRITDVGAEHIANGLRMNRTLLSLSSACNQIGDKGAARIAEALSRFPLTHEEVVERRRQISEKGSPERNKSPPPSRRADSKDRPGSVRSSTHTDKDKSKREKPSTKKKDPKGTKEEDKKGKGKEKDDKAGTKKAFRLLSVLTASIAADAGKTVGKTKDRKRDKKPTPQEQELPDVPEVISPLLEVADHIDGQLWVAGNRILINLNLSRNNISEVGMASLLKAMQYQTTLTLDSKTGGTGLMRISLHRNGLSSDHNLLKKITELMGPKDPFYKPPLSPEGETA